GIVSDTAQSLWLAMSSGIYRVSQDSIQKSLADPQTPLVCKLMSEAKTAPESAMVFGGTRALLLPEGRLWFATSEGVLNVDTRGPYIESASRPLYIESVAFNGEPPVSLLN